MQGLQRILKILMLGMMEAGKPRHLMLRPVLKTKTVHRLHSPRPADGVNGVTAVPASVQTKKRASRAKIEVMGKNEVGL